MLDKTTALDLWARLKELYMTKSLANKIRLKKRLYTFKIAEGTLVQKHLNDFDSIIVDLESLDVKVEDENKAILLVVSLAPSYKHFKEVYCWVYLHYVCRCYLVESIASIYCSSFYYRS